MNNDTTTKYEVLPWSEYFNTGIAEIDEQHKKWITLLNLLAEHSNNHANETILDTVFNELFAYTEYHFATEESIWQRFFPDDEWESKHKEVHQCFIVELHKLKAEKETEPLEKVIIDVIEFLVPWLAYHILVTDKRMANIVLAIQSGMSLENAKQQSEQEIANYKPDNFSFKCK
ncbi:MAG: hemerythrin family protein [Methylococcaceae bacterium]